MSARTLIAAALAEANTGIAEVIDTFEPVGEREPDAGPFMQVFSAGYLPSGFEGILRARFEVWLCVPTRDAAEAEDELDQLLPDLLAMLNGLNWLEWDEVTPGIHESGYYGYVTTITTITDSIS